ncbi:FtsH protease activity modulator HflK [Candidatus Calescamantes bacterium]|nr:FtsH protease activity modulator HflK [Candidatus Calescamantes bacterium]
MNGDIIDIHPENLRKIQKAVTIGSRYFVIFIFLIVLLKTSFYTIQPDEVGVVQRFGRFTKISKPGLHFKLPFSIERITPVKTEYVFKEEFGFRTRKPGVRTIYEEKGYEDESLMLTGDLNVLDAEWIVQFKIKDPVKYLFEIRNPRKTLRDISESMIRQVIGDYTFDEVLTTKRVEVNNLVQQKMQEILDLYQAGIEVVTVKLQDVNPPDPVKPAFNEVNEAKQEREKLINQAWEVYNRKIPEARGEALKIVMEAEAYATEIVNRAEGNAKKFSLLLEAYKKSEEITRRRIYLEAMQEILEKAGKKYIIDSEERGILPLLQLEK